jgi:ribosomal-protein-alanine N-acetyltransferase
MLDPHIRWMINRDMPSVYVIEHHSFEFPWTRDDFWRCLRTRNCIALVAECEEAVAGYVVYEIHRDRLRILNFAVHQDLRRQHVGDTMVRKLIGKLTPLRRNRITLEVRESNLQAQLFWRAMGFRAIGIEHRFYDETNEDAYVFQYQISSTERPDREIIRSIRLS